MSKIKHLVLKTKYGYEIRILKEKCYTRKDIKYYYQVVVWDNDNIFPQLGKYLYDVDPNISRLLGISPDKYQQFIIKKFNGYKRSPNDNNIRFLNENDAKKAGEWLANSLILSKIK
jgi:hypothetical protein